MRRVLRRPYRHYTARAVDLRAEQVAEQPPAACLLLRRAVLGDRLFDEDYRLFFNDTDLARRLNADGSCWYAGQVTAVHLRGESFTRVRAATGYAVAREYDRTLLRYARRHVRGWQVLVPVLLARRIGMALAERRPAGRSRRPPARKA